MTDIYNFSACNAWNWLGLQTLTMHLTKPVNALLGWTSGDFLLKANWQAKLQGCQARQVSWTYCWLPHKVVVLCRSNSQGPCQSWVRGGQGQKGNFLQGWCKVINTIESNLNTSFRGYFGSKSVLQRTVLTCCWNG